MSRPNCCRRSARAGSDCAPSRPISARCFPEAPPIGGAPPAIMPGREPPQIRGYDMQAVLGQGGMGIVYKAWHVRLNRPVALKMLLTGVYARPSELERFLREAEAVAGLRHPNIVQVHDVGDLDGRPYFTMEYVEGGSLLRKDRRHASAGRPGGRAGGGPGPGHPRRSPRWDRSPRSQAGQHPAHRRRHAQDHGFRPGPKAGRGRRAHPDRCPAWGRPATWPPSRPRARSMRSGRRRTCTRWGRSSTSC